MLDNRIIKERFFKDPFGLSLNEYLLLVKLTIYYTIDIGLNYLVYVLNKFFLKDMLLSLWGRSNIVKWNKTKSIIDCPYCKSSNSEYYASVQIKNGLSLFDHNERHLQIYYGNIFPEIIWNQSHRFRRIWIQTVLNTPTMYGEISKIQYRKCNDCKIVFQNFPHTENSLNNHYGKYYRRESGAEFTRVHDKESYRLRNEHRAKQIVKVGKLQKSMKILDVGAADGWLCLAMQKLGMDAYGIEPSQKMVERAKQIGVQNIQCRPYNKQCFEEANFDAIHCFHVMEHMLSIKQTLRVMNAHLKLQGQLSLSVPCVDHIKNSKDQELVLLFDHVYCFTKEWFVLNLPKYGFDIYEIQLNQFDANTHPEIPAICLNGDHLGGIFVFAKKLKEINNGQFVD